MMWRALVLFSFAASQAVAQDTLVIRAEDVPPPGLPVEQWAVEFFNRSSTTRIVGSRTVELGASLRGNVAILGGTFTVEGEIEGTLVAINGNVVIGRTARVAGNVIVLGGTLEDDPEAVVGGTMRRHSGRVDVTYANDRLRLDTPARRARREEDRPTSLAYGSSSIVLGFDDTYNRVEGLPLRLGLRAVWGGRAFESRLRGYGVFRTAGDFKGTREDVGYNLDWSLRFGRSPSLTVTARYHDLVIPTQDTPLEIHEVGWASFLWHRDYRDYFLQRGWTGLVSLMPVRDLTIFGSLGQYGESSIAERDPWTPFRNSEIWRPNPGVDHGDLTLITTGVTFDARPHQSSRMSGWFGQATWERGLGANMVERPLDPAIRGSLPVTGYRFDRGEIDVRRYQNVGRGQLRVRGYWAGQLGGDPLPIQRRFSLGGPDPLNGYPFRAVSCNNDPADATQVGLCDHVLLLQGEFRGPLGFDWFDDLDYEMHRVDRDDRDRGARWFRDAWFDSPVIVLFSNAGTGWLDDRDPPTLRFDVGVGIEVGSFGFYVAKAIADGEPVRATLRVERRF